MFCLFGSIVTVIMRKGHLSLYMVQHSDYGAFMKCTSALILEQWTQDLLTDSFHLQDPRQISTVLGKPGTIEISKEHYKHKKNNCET